MLVAGGLAGGFRLARMGDLARTSNDSKWYPLTADLKADLANLDLAGWKKPQVDQINNQHLLDLRDVASPPEFKLINFTRLISRTESWELSAEAKNPNNDVGYPSLVVSRDSRGKKTYHLFYAIHDVASGIGLARANALEGPFTKIGGGQAPDSRILRPPTRPRKTSHLSSPVAIWNAVNGVWHLYFHYYSNQFAEGLGHQNTAVAISKDLRNWEVVVGSDGDFLAVLPVTKERWMNSQSTYHSIQLLPNGLWLAFLRGTSVHFRDGELEADPTSLGFAVSRDGIRWSLVSGEPPFPSLPLANGHPVTQRPGFCARLRDRYLVCWTEQNEFTRVGRARLATTRNFSEFEVLATEIPITVHDGAMTPWRVGNAIYLLAGPYLYKFAVA